MTYVLDMPTQTVEALEATDGRSFFAQETITEPDSPEFTEPTREDLLSTCLISQRQAAHHALITLGRIEEVRQIKDTHAALPNLLPAGVVEEANYEMMDQSSVWSRQTDAISRAIAQEFPNQCVVDCDDYMFISDSYKLFKVDSGGTVWAYSSVISQHEMNLGVRVASQEMWHDLLIQIMTHH